MKDVLRVRRREAPSCLDEQAHDFGPRPLLRCKPICERAPLDVLHGNEDLLPERAHVVDRDDVGVRQLGHGLRFAQQPRASLTGTHFSRCPRADQLEGNFAAQLWIVRGVHQSHPAAAELALDDVAAQGPDRQGCCAGFRRFSFAVVRESLGNELGGRLVEKVPGLLIRGQKRLHFPA